MILSQGGSDETELVCADTISSRAMPIRFRRNLIIYWNIAGRRARTAHQASSRAGRRFAQQAAFVAAYEAEIYKKNGLDVEQFITQSAADVARRTGIIVPKELIRAGGRDTPIVIGGGSPLIVRWTTDAQADDRVIVRSEERRVGK